MKTELDLAIETILKHARPPEGREARGSGAAPLLEALVETVNRFRYRGPLRDEPMYDDYVWPMPLAAYERIGLDALRYVVELEKASNDSSADADGR